MITTGPHEAVPVPLRIEVSFPASDTVRLAVSGELDLATAPVLSMRLRTVMSDHKPSIVDVDLAEVGFLDCYGIGELVAVRNAGKQVNCRVWISCPQPMTARILDIVGLLELFTAPAQPSGPDSRNTVTALPMPTRFARMARAMIGRIAA